MLVLQFPKYFEKENMTNTTLALIYLEQVSLCYNYSFIYDFLIIHPETSTGVSEKGLFELF